MFKKNSTLQRTNLPKESTTFITQNVSTLAKQSVHGTLTAYGSIVGFAGWLVGHHNLSSLISRIHSTTAGKIYCIASIPSPTRTSASLIISHAVCLRAGVTCSCLIDFGPRRRLKASRKVVQSRCDAINNATHNARLGFKVKDNQIAFHSILWPRATFACRRETTARRGTDIRRQWKVCSVLWAVLNACRLVSSSLLSHVSPVLSCLGQPPLLDLSSSARSDPSL